MTSPVSPSDHVAPTAALSAVQNAASRHAVWLSAAAIITDQIGRVLLVHPTYRGDDRWLLPGGAADPDEHPLDACRREIAEELALRETALPRVLAVHSLSPHHPDIRPGIPCPGEIRYIFDGGTLTPDQIQAIRLPSTELSEFAFFETRDAVRRLLPVDGKIFSCGCVPLRPDDQEGRCPLAGHPALVIRRALRGWAFLSLVGRGMDGRGPCVSRSCSSSSRRSWT
ncbi:NUDIX domain-containing protein [Streptomyces galilaeus]|uniref:NUDIX domain-containing protein n=1 Tax=Streptomyces galilaeus TaxID=33899 RepID=UPI0038F61B45